ncbi:MFS transporter [Paenibacillus medicaginis]|uniref:MFS transporter n=1 Tax=Paenibacillus medicaginis TaxID=1470560 RepID=A0ABV5C383_9BACL
MRAPLLRNTELMSKTMKPLWKNRDFVLIWMGTSISGLTFQFYLIALPLIIFDHTKSALAMSIMRSVEVIPNVLLAAAIGVLVDRYYRKHIMRWSIGVQISALLVLLCIILLHIDQLWVVYVVAFLVGAAEYAFWNAYHSTLPLVVSREQLTSANASLISIESTINVAGPAIAGFILSLVSYSTGIIGSICGLTLLYIMVSFTDIPQTSAPKTQKTGFLAEFVEGWAQLISTPSLRIMTTMILFVNIGSAIAGGIMLFYARNDLHASALGVGVIYASIAFGTMLSGLIAKPSRRLSGRGTLMLFSVLIAVVGQITMFLSTTWVMLAWGMFFMGFSAGFTNIHYFTLRQELTPNHLLGRVAGASSMVTKLALPVAYLVSGILGSWIGANYMFLMSACVLMLIFSYGLVIRLWKYI